MSLPDVVQRFKSLTTTRYRHGVAQQAWSPFPGRLWQRNYYEHVIRTEESLFSIRSYIAANPERWALDRENPECVAPPPSKGLPFPEV
jgi:REP-associated tyrosine transposase